MHSFKSALSVARAGSLASLLLLAASAGAHAQAQAVEYRLAAVADTTIFAESNGGDTYDNISDGSGESLWLSSTAGGVVRRALLRFDLSALPSDLQVTAVTFTLWESRARDEHQVTAHRLLAGWGEGSSDGGSQGLGALAQAGDATWRWRDYQQTEWAQRGGDFVAAPSASLSVGGQNSFYTWGSSAGLVADVQGWLANPGTNHGWILIGNEVASQNAKRFDSRHSTVESLRPLLVVTASAVPEPGSWALLLLGAGMLLACRRQPGFRVR